ncbi:hypothetical protein [Desulfomonile tiedjei]|uniref:Uncharacterized protein n=1 Tax=Desulfomonile tiedjei (strain ATCC 49306 / DSM 6799 / DCB-1) TaxID=706587 RepID=I4C9M1_DESTA|nr:hypothetical protein [Desulfomonile tiedjei]AFM26262.1 hypothetical protein Desti_3614 [Desulfomonile tiedjei DSM 6799]
MKVDRKLAEKSLQAKGFVKDKSHDHPCFFHCYEGKETGIKTWMSHSKKYKDIGPDNLESMRRQLKLETRRETIALLECPMSQSEYNEHLIQKGLLVIDEND